MNQNQLRYLYNSAKARMEYHPDHAKECINTIRELPRYGSEKEAFEAAAKLEKDNPDGVFKIWATIGKDEEYFQINAPWLVTTDGEQMKAAEYIGMLSENDCRLLNEE